MSELRLKVERLERPIAVPITVASGVATLRLSRGLYHTLTLTANVTSWVLDVPPKAGNCITLMVKFIQGAGPYTVAWPASFKWEGGVAGTVSTGSGDVDLLAMTTWDMGTTWYVTLAKDWA